jgi:hypothetical protein
LALSLFTINIKAAKAGEICRDYTRTVFAANGQPRQAFGTACLATDGSWRVQSESLSRHQNGLYAAAIVNNGYAAGDNRITFFNTPPVAAPVTMITTYPVYRWRPVPVYTPVRYTRVTTDVFAAQWKYGHGYGHGYGRGRGHGYGHAAYECHGWRCP